MKTTQRWLGLLASPASLELGDIFVVEHHQTTYLAMKMKLDETDYALILRTFGEKTPDVIPGLVYFESFTADSPVRRLDGGELLIEPTELAADKVFAPVGSTAMNGSLGLFEADRRAIFIKAGSPPVWIDLNTGEAIPPGQKRVRIDAWRLTWRFGKETVELVRMPI